MNNAGLFQGGTRSYDVSGRILDIADSATGSLTITAATASMFQNFTDDDAFVTLAILNGTISNGVLADHTLVFNGAFA